MLNLRAIPPLTGHGDHLCDLGDYRAYVDRSHRTAMVRVIHVQAGKEVRALYVDTDSTFTQYLSWCGEESDYLPIFCLAHLMLYGDYPKHTTEKVRDQCTT